MLKKYKIIYADPPWKYDRKIGEGVAEKQYPTMEQSGDMSRDDFKKSRDVFLKKGNFNRPM